MKYLVAWVEYAEVEANTEREAYDKWANELNTDGELWYIKDEDGRITEYQEV